MYGHVPPDTASRGEHHLTVATLVHPPSLVGPQVGVETAPADECLTALVTHKWPLSGVGASVLLQVGGFLENLKTTNYKMDCRAANQSGPPRLGGISCPTLAGSLWHKGAYNRTFPCMEATYP